DIIDVGGESSRPGAEPVSAQDEIRRVVPVIQGLKNHLPDTLISIDTSKALVAAAALEAGADLVNDITAGADTAMLATVASYGAGIVLMHMRGQPRTMQENTAYTNVTAEVHAFLALRAEQAIDAGIPRDLVWIDPGIGFGKDDPANVRLLADLPDLAALGHPIVLGVSRKSMIGRLTGAEVDDRLPGSLAALTPTIGLPRVIVRVHDLRPTLQFLKILAAIEEAHQ
ncbi:MAG: dihydropteroate synthase, partial [Acidobacteria bacterium]